MSTDGAGPRDAGPDDAAQLVDARGRRCPQPVIDLAHAAAGAAPGTRLLLLATDPAARHDVAAWCRMRGHLLGGVTGPDDAGTWRLAVLTSERPAR